MLELPEELIAQSSGAQVRALRAWLAHCLAATAEQVRLRLPKQDFCGVVISPAKEQAIVAHWVQLGDQRPPYKEDSVLFRYQDPRVMQRVWPSLSTRQQDRWLGPVTQWWSLRQPWGPFNTAPEAAEWFQAKASTFPPDGQQAPGSPRNMFEEAQWFLSGLSPEANLIWRGYAENDIPSQAQPNASTMVQMLADAARLGMQGGNVEDYIWTTWMHAPKDGLPRAMDWKLPHLSPVMSRIQAQLRNEPDARFSSASQQSRSRRKVNHGLQKSLLAVLSIWASHFVHALRRRLQLHPQRRGRAGQDQARRKFQGKARWSEH